MPSQRNSVTAITRHSVTGINNNAAMKTIGDRIRATRRRMSVSVKDLARLTGLAASTIYDIENGHQTSSTKLHLIAKHLGLNVQWLEDGTGPSAGTAPPVVSDALVVHGLQLTVEAARLGQEWLKLEEPTRSAIALTIYSMVAAQIKTNRAAKKPPDPPHPLKN